MAGMSDEFPAVFGHVTLTVQLMIGPFQSAPDEETIVYEGGVLSFSGHHVNHHDQVLEGQWK